MSTRIRLTARHPRPATPERAPVRRGSATARKPVRPAASAAPAAKTPAKPAGARGDGRTTERSGTKAAAPRDRDTAKRPARTAPGERPVRPRGEGFGDDRRPARARGEGFGDDRRPARARSEGFSDGHRPARPRSEGFGDERRPARPRSEGFSDDRRPARARGEGFGDDRRPARARGEGFGDDRRPARARSEGFGDDRRPARARGEGFGDDRRPARPRGEGFGADRRPARPRNEGFSDDRRPARPRGESAGDERRPARPRGEGFGDRERKFGDRKAPGAAPRREYGSSAEGRRPRDEGTRRASSERPAREERSFARPVKAASGYRDDAPARKFATRVKQDDRAPRSAPVESAEGAPHRAPHTGSDAAGSLRLSKRMSELGLCSRREADEWIEKGWVLVDGERMDTLGTKVTPDQRIEIDPAARAAQARQVTILLHKPVGYVSGQAEDGYPPAATLVTAANQWDGDRSGVRFSPLHLRTLAPAGRLDIDSTGLLVLTQDGRVAKQLIGEQSDIDKEYLVRVTYDDIETDIDQHFPADLLAKLRHGLSLDDVPLKPAMVSWQNGEQLRFVLREGKKRQIRRMCELVGLKVVGLKRVRMGRVLLGALPQGQWRYLTPDESF